jgi:hypothetical protein
MQELQASVSRMSQELQQLMELVQECQLQPAQQEALLALVLQGAGEIINRSGAGTY